MSREHFEIVEQAKGIRESLKRNPALKKIIDKNIQKLNAQQPFDLSEISRYRDDIIAIYRKHVKEIGNAIPSESYKEFFKEIVLILANAKTIERTPEDLNSNLPQDPSTQKKELDHETEKFINELFSHASNQETTEFIDGLKKTNKGVETNPYTPLITAEDLAKKLLKEIISYEEKRAELEAYIAKLASELGEIIPDFVLREDPADNIDIIEELQGIYKEELSILDSFIDIYKRKRDMGLEEASNLEKKIKDRSDEIEKNIKTTKIIERILAALEEKREITQEEDRLINLTHKLFFERFNSANRLDFLKEISDTPYFRGYLDLKYEGKNILDIAIEEKDIESINILINKIKQKCPDFFKNSNMGSNMGETLIKKLNAIAGTLDDNGLKKIKLLQEEIGRAMTLPRAAEASERVLPIGNISSIEHQDSSCRASSPPYMSPTKSSLSKAVGNLTTPQPATKEVNSPSTFNTPLKICKSFLSLLSKKPQIPGYQGSTISSDLRKSPKSKAGFDSSTHEGNTPPLEFDPKDLINKTEVDSCRFSKRSKSLDIGDPKTSERFMSQSRSEIKPCKLGFSGNASGEHPCKLDRRYSKRTEDTRREQVISFIIL
ncbi:MAG: hypothetical protein ISP24_04470 [Rickettsiales bacterium]|nr:hypothetical protein [Rickettsiales bacterium]